MAVEQVRTPLYPIHGLSGETYLDYPSKCSAVQELLMHATDGLISDTLRRTLGAKKVGFAEDGEN